MALGIQPDHSHHAQGQTPHAHDDGYGLGKTGPAGAPGPMAFTAETVQLYAPLGTAGYEAKVAPPVGPPGNAGPVQATK